MKTITGLSILTGAAIFGIAAVVEAAWLMFAEGMVFGAPNEAVLLLESFGFYILAGAIVGTGVGLLTAAYARAARSTPDKSHVLLTALAGIAVLFSAGAAITYVFQFVLPYQIGINAFLGIVVLIAMLGAAFVLFLLVRRLLLRFLGGVFERRLGKRVFAAWMIAGVLVPMLVLAGIFHFQTSGRSTALETAPTMTNAAKKEMPNVILITLDTVRAASLPLYGYDRETSPNLARFAAEAVLHERAYSHSAWTLPSHQTLFTGRYPSEISSMWGCGKLGDAHVTLAEVLKAGGYRTGAVVGGPFCTANRGLSQGFDYYEDRLPGSTPFLSQLINRLIPDLFSAVGKRRADQSNGFVFEWLERNSSAPFFLFINYFDAHLRLNPKPRYRAAFEGDYSLLHGFLMSQGDYDSDVTQRTRTPGEAEHAHWRTLYDCEILFLDSELGRLFRTLKELGVYDNSIIVITSDHGNSFGEHHLAGHGGWVFEEQVRVPLVIRRPFGRLGGTKDSKRIGLVNLFSLILNEAGIEVPPTAHSAHPDSLNEVCVLENGRKNPAGRWKFAYAGRDLRAIYAGPFKLVTADDQPIELYNLDQDPGESTNLLEADSPTAQTLRDRLAEILKTMLPAPEEEEGEDTIDKKLLEQMKSVGYL